MTRKASGKSKAPPIKRQATAAKAKLAKVRGCTVAELELDAAKMFARLNADEAERLHRQLADTVREAAADTSALAQQVTTAKMWTRYERHKRRQAEQLLGSKLVQAVAAAQMQPTMPTEMTTGDKLPPLPPGMEWVKIHIAAKRLGCSKDKIRQRAKECAIPYHKKNPKKQQTAAWYGVPMRQLPQP